MLLYPYLGQDGYLPGAGGADVGVGIAGTIKSKKKKKMSRRKNMMYTINGGNAQLFLYR